MYAYIVSDVRHFSTYLSHPNHHGCVIDLADMSYEPVWPRNDGDGSCEQGDPRRNVFLTLTAARRRSDQLADHQNGDILSGCCRVRTSLINCSTALGI